MSVKRVIDNAKYIEVDSAGADLTANFDFPEINILHVDRISFGIAWTGNPVGTVSIQTSNDGIDWTNINSTMTPAGVPDYDYEQEEVFGRLVRLSYSRTSGSGTLKAYLVAKSISG